MEVAPFFVDFHHFLSIFTIFYSFSRFTHFCRNLHFVAIYALFPQIYFGQNSLPRNITRFLHVCPQTHTTCIFEILDCKPLHMIALVIIETRCPKCWNCCFYGSLVLYVIIFRGKVLIIITVYSIENTVLCFWNSLSTIIIVIVRQVGQSAVNHEPWTRVSHYH